MSTIKTAISIDKDVYNNVIHITKELHISKSQFFSQAAQYMIDRKKNLNLLKKINIAYGNLHESDEEKTYTRAAKQYRLKRTEEQWK
jgi:metal-responsive CopG/Arc/MetJ family transcriptional regulator